ncbi:hypothetical protein [Poseidonocella sp. HB161398]|uniref:hypothetical protein n=1 Tax=Poseidonocella sp. HB161398 TaxID=2320855 RepID=UPI001109097F|nr:hypothetical protein [Poseidonocella sp. HB161398]
MTPIIALRCTSNGGFFNPEIGHRPLMPYDPVDARHAYLRALHDKLGPSLWLMETADLRMTPSGDQQRAVIWNMYRRGRWQDSIEATGHLWCEVPRFNWTTALRASEVVPVIKRGLAAAAKQRGEKRYTSKEARDREQQKRERAVCEALHHFGTECMTPYHLTFGNGFQCRASSNFDPGELFGDIFAPPGGHSGPELRA